jgi:diguanylate cyclase (GGDEF)-like protein/PAS domain S-box-containing protein
MRGQRTKLIEESYSFSDLVDIDTFSQLANSIFQATGIPNGLVDPAGELITQSGWIDACDTFYRTHPETAQLCKESNLELMSKLSAGEVAGCLCKNGLYDYATPIVVEGKQLATLFLGQVLDAPPDMEFFRKQADRYGFDEVTFLDAIRSAPIVSRKEMEAHMDYLANMAQMLAASGLAKLRESRLKQDLHASTERRVQMEDLLEFSPVGISWCDAEGNIEYVNHQFTSLFGYTLQDLPDLETWIAKAYPVEKYRKQILEPWIQQVEDNYQLGTLLPELESDIRCKDGSKRRVVTRVSWVGKKKLASFTDITARWRSEQRIHTQGAILGMIAQAEPLSRILHAIVREIESEIPGAYGSVLLLDEEGKRLYTSAAPRLPLFYNEAINGLEIGMGVGSCGTAAFLGERVIVEDIATHEYWQPYKDLAKSAGLAACWSEPIIDPDGRVLGTFAIYHAEPTTPNEDHIQLITLAADLAAIAITSRNSREASIKRERVFRTLAENAPINIARYDRDGHLIYTNPRLANNLPNFVAQLMGKRFDEYPDLPFTEDFQKAFDQTMQTGRESSFETLVPCANGSIETHLINMVAEQDDSGAITGALAIGLDITERKRLEEQLSASEREFRTLAENAPINISRYDRQGRKIYVNHNLAVSLGQPVDQLLGRSFAEQSEMPYNEIFQEAFEAAIQSGETTTFEIEFPAENGEIETHLIHMVAERDESGAVFGALATGQNITERKRLEKELERQAHVDYLTGLVNRRYFIELAENELSRINRYGGKLSLILFDLDLFKQINDTFGHSSGDLVLHEIGEISRNTMREIDIIARIGGEEFVVVLPQTGLQEAADAAERLRQAIEKGSIQLDNGKLVRFTASFGVVTIRRKTDVREENVHIDELLKRADRAMYQAKDEGRNRVCLDRDSEGLNHTP